MFTFKQVRVVCVSLAAWLSGTTAFAGGIEFPDNGTRALGRGGAFAANPDDGYALQYNPAGFAQQTGLRLTFDSKITNASFSFDPADNQATVNNQGSPFYSPGGMVSYGFGSVGPFSELTIAVGAYGPSAVGKLKFPETGAQRYGLISSDYFIAYYSLAAAASIGDWLSFGGGFQLAAGHAKFRQAAYSGLAPSISNPADDAIAEVDVKGLRPTGIVGVTVKPVSKLAIGASWRPALEFTGSGDFTIVKFSETAKSLGARQVGDSADLTLQFPDVVRVGIQYQPTSALLLAIDGVYERWSSLDAIRVDVDDVNVEIPGTPYSGEVADIVLKKHFRDTYSVRVGADYCVLPERLTLRAGYAYETRAVPPKYVNVDFSSWGRHMVAAGASVALFGAYIDVAYAHHFIEKQSITASDVTQLTSPDLGFGAPPSSVAGNGEYRAALDVFSIMLRVPFDELRSAI